MTFWDVTQGTIAVNNVVPNITIVKTFFPPNRVASRPPGTAGRGVVSWFDPKRSDAMRIVTEQSRHGCNFHGPTLHGTVSPKEAGKDKPLFFV